MRRQNETCLALHTKYRSGYCSGSQTPFGNARLRNSVSWLATKRSFQERRSQTEFGNEARKAPKEEDRLLGESLRNSRLCAQLLHSLPQFLQIVEEPRVRLGHAAR